MPFVSGYFRRAPGGAANEAGGQRRRLDVAIYDASGDILLRDATGGRWGVKNLAYASLLPGGFATASFRLERPTARSWPGRAGLKVVIRRGNNVVWWGWIEDLRRAIRGGIEAIDVTALGPYQQVRQRLFSPAYTGTMYGDAALAQELYAYCPDISDDYTGLAQTTVNIAPLTWTNRSVHELVSLVCGAGNSAGKPMLFAVWEPTGTGTSGYPAAINLNPSFEEEAFAGSGYPAHWSELVFTGDPRWVWTTASYNSPSHGAKVYRGTVAGTQVGWVATHPSNRFDVVAGTTYVVDYWVYFGAVASMSCYARMNWYNAGGGTISQVALTVRNSTGSAFGARYVESTVAPALAVKCQLDLVFALPDSGSNSYLIFDDAYVYATGAQTEQDTRPKAWLWARDLSAADYYLYTAELDAALGADLTTRELANYVVAKYGSSYTAASQNAASQTDYRRRDAVVDAGSESGATVAAAVRDTYLARHKDPADEPGSFRLVRPGAVRTSRGAVVWPEDLRAGDRLQIADGPLAGTVVLLKGVEYANGAVTCTPERPDDVPLLLARM